MFGFCESANAVQAAANKRAATVWQKDGLRVWGKSFIGRWDGTGCPASPLNVND